MLITITILSAFLAAQDAGAALASRCSNNMCSAGPYGEGFCSCWESDGGKRCFSTVERCAADAPKPVEPRPAELVPMPEVQPPTLFTPSMFGIPEIPKDGMPAVDFGSPESLLNWAAAYSWHAIQHPDEWQRWLSVVLLLLFVWAFRNKLQALPQKYTRILGLSASAVPGVFAHLMRPDIPLGKAMGASFAVWLMAVGGWAGVIKLLSEIASDAQEMQKAAGGWSGIPAYALGWWKNRGKGKGEPPAPPAVPPG